jgi:LAS superfamily LD-carboxypeptidase LdcB
MYDIINKEVNMSRKKRKKKKNLFLYLDILLIIVIAVGLFIIVKNHNKSESNSNDSSNIDNNIIEETPPPDPNKEKYEKLNNINKKLDFFKDDYLDRYIEYKDKHPELDDETIVVYVNIGLDKDFYTDVKDSPNKYTNTVLANKIYYLGDDYVPKDLTTINNSYSSGNKQMTKDAALAFEEMARDAKKSGYTVRAVSTYRSYSYQTNLYNNYAKQDGTAKADTYSARAGYSEHQTGLAVDVDNAKVSYTKFGTTKEFGWMKDNAYKYGFILRYTKETEFITGYMNEPWHYRYVGKDIAKYIYEHPMTYEEYYVRFLENK